VLIDREATHEIHAERARRVGRLEHDQIERGRDSIDGLAGQVDERPPGQLRRQRSQIASRGPHEFRKARWKIPGSHAPSINGATKAPPRTEGPLNSAHRSRACDVRDVLKHCRERTHS
jgi:hypothetical protein